MITLLAANELPSTFFDAAALARFWFYVKWVTIFLMPIIMICFAILTADKFLDMILGIFGYTTQRPNDDEDYEIRHY